MKHATITVEVAVEDQDQNLLLLVGDTIRNHFSNPRYRVNIVSVHTEYDADYYTVQATDFNRRFIEAWGRKWDTGSIFGPFLPQDIGKRIYRVLDEGAMRGPGASPIPRYILQMENDEQFRRRTNA